jgi:hypothetical protein
MMVSSSLHKRKALLVGILFIAFFSFTADILDLREELRFLSCPNSSLDNDITTGITGNFPFETEPVLFSCYSHRKSLVKISFLHLLPYGFRAPPSWS